MQRKEGKLELTAAGVQSLDILLEPGSTDTIVEILNRGRHMSFLPRFAVADALANHHTTDQG
jgi:hypothetical protein